MLIFLIVAFLIALACLVYDAYMSAKGIKAGIALEGNAVVTSISGTKSPSFWKIFLIEAGVIRVPIFILGAVTNVYLAFLFAISLLTMGLKNVQSARQWQWMFSHPGQKLPEANTVWQKFFGFWG